MRHQPAEHQPPAVGIEDDAVEAGDAGQVDQDLDTRPDTAVQFDEEVCAAGDRTRRGAVLVEERQRVLEGGRRLVAPHPLTPPLQLVHAHGLPAVGSWAPPL